MKKILLLLILSSNLFAGFFDNFMPTSEYMLDFYHQNSPDMFPNFDREKRLEEQNADSIIDGDSIS